MRPGDPLLTILPHNHEAQALMLLQYPRNKTDNTGPGRICIQAQLMIIVDRPVKLRNFWLLPRHR